MSLSLTKFCQHCKKTGHTDDECWSTRQVGQAPQPLVWPWIHKSPLYSPPMTESEVRRIVREELARDKEQP